MSNKYQMFGLVRDGATGKPKVDDPSTLHPMQIGMMSKVERAELGLPDVHYARDAQGIKPVQAGERGELIALEPLVAVSELFMMPDDGSGANVVTLPERRDVRAGSVI